MVAILTVLTNLVIIKNKYDEYFNITNKTCKIDEDVYQFNDEDYDVFENKIVDRNTILKIAPHGVKLIKSR